MTTIQELGAIEKVDNVRGVWPTEDGYFTPWLAENLDKLGEELGMDLEMSETEAQVGTFKLDVLARDVDTKGEVVIENQFGNTDHTHLGQLLTYAGGFDAQAVVWIAESFRDEHRQALDFLNLRTGENTQFFGVEIQLWSIDGSLPAPHFKLVAFPNEWRKQAVTSTGVSDNVSERRERYRQFFQELIDTLREEHRFTGSRTGRPQNWHTFASGFSGLPYGANFTSEREARVELYIGKDDRDWNKEAFDKLKEQKNSIESALGEPLVWQRLENAKACRISVVMPGSIDDDDDTLEKIRQWMVERLLKFKEVFRPRLNELAK